MSLPLSMTPLHAKLIDYSKIVSATGYRNAHQLIDSILQKAITQAKQG